MNNQIQPQEQQHIAYANPDSISCEGLYINFLPFSIELGPQAMQLGVKTTVFETRSV
jgi:hypothetical protein